MQSVGIGRAIVREPSILLMDEPISHLEARQRARMREELVELQKRLGTTSIYVTHDQVEAMTMASRIAVMNLGELQQVGTPKDVYEQPRTEFVGGFIGEPPMNFADCEIRRENGTFYAKSASFKIPLGAELTSILNKLKEIPKTRLGIRPESISVSFTPTEHSAKAVVYVLEPQGERTILTTRLENGEYFLVEVPPTFEAEVDAVIYLQFREPIHLFDTTSGINLFYV
jgi:multiple sugar transport system ATP-binding protein